MRARQFFFSTALILGASLFVTGCFDDPVEIDGKGAKEIIEPETTVDKSSESRVFVFSKGSKIRFGRVEGGGGPKGGFTNFIGRLDVANGTLVPDGEHSISVDMNSVFTTNLELTESLKDDDFFAITFFPTARLNIGEVVSVGEGMVEMSGVFDFHGVSKEVNFPATFSINGAGDRLELKAELTLNWRDFGITPSGESENLVWEEAVLQIEIVASPGEPGELDLTPELRGPPLTQSGEANPREGERGRFGGKGGKGGKGGEDWRNMSEEERAERRREFIAEMDTNGDGNLAKGEVPERMWEFMGAADQNGDDMISETERNQFRAEREAERTMRELNGEEPRGFGDGRGPGGRGPGQGGGRGGSE